MRVFKSEDGFTIAGMEPPDANRFTADDRKMFYGWVVEIALRQKDRDLAKGLDKDGNALHPISANTRKYRKSAMTPSGKGDPSAPPLIPGWQKSRTRSLLTGKAFVDRAEFWWRYDAHTGDSWARILDYQASMGRDVFGLSPAAMTRVRAQAWERWHKWQRGKVIPVAKEYVAVAKPMRAGSYDTRYLDVMGHAEEIAKGQHIGFLTFEKLQEYMRQSAPARLVGRPRMPKVMSPISGPQYNRLIAQTLTLTKRAGPGGSGGIPVRAPKPLPFAPQAEKFTTATATKPRAPKKKAETVPSTPQRFANHDEVATWAKKLFPKAEVTTEGVSLESWHVIADELDRMVAKFPAVADNIIGFGANDSHPTGVAWVKPNDIKGDALYFHPNYWGDIKKVKKVFDKSVKVGWAVEGTEHAGPQYFVTHEFGHLVDNYTRRNDRPKYLEFRKVFEGADGYFDPEKGATVSEYGATNGAEAFAESFAGAKWSIKPSPLVGVIKEMFGL